MKNQIMNMIVLQTEMNMTIHPHWHEQGYKWTRAIMVEGVEALEHYGWKWWKQQVPDLAQVRMELVDIWHFILSDYLQNYIPQTMSLADHLEATFTKGPPALLIESHPRLCLEMLIGRAASGEVNMNAFMALMVQFELPFDDLYRLYVAKNVLNMFRQAHGYKEGTYIKDWGGKEDNVVLDHLLLARPNASPEQLKVRLGQLYASVKI